MSQPTIEEIEEIIIQYSDYLNGHKTMAKAIHALFHPVRKPLSELANSEEDCRKVFEFITGNEDYLWSQCDTESIDLYGQADFHVEINFNGEIQYYWYDEVRKISNPFELVRFINNLGYDAITETI